MLDTCEYHMCIVYYHIVYVHGDFGRKKPVMVSISEQNCIHGIMALSRMSTFSIPTWNKYGALGEGMSDEDISDIEEYEEDNARCDEHFEA